MGAVRRFLAPLAEKMEHKEQSFAVLLDAPIGEALHQPDELGCEEATLCRGGAKRVLRQAIVVGKLLADSCCVHARLLRSIKRISRMSRY